MCFMLIVLTISVLSTVDNAPLTRWEKNSICEELPVLVLGNILGGAFNSRYMSIDRPIEEKPQTGGKRGVSFAEDFYVDNDFIEQLDNKPAWDVTNLVVVSKKKYGLHRSKRGVDYLQQWHCKSKIEWTDLGPDYFPRYLKSVVCLSENCWFGLYKCKPRSFSVNLLRRKKGFCAKGGKSTHKVGVSGLPNDLKEMWVWEERAVNFCCDCTRV
ncbi:protein trunk-like [Tribolium madens]|uniref:protein trunk-like n=1 Tax=Tribolium madens TaxID=41895 RepID=UPI001CF7564C|nr:protein trunk-like [Tribolium madens]